MRSQKLEILVIDANSNLLEAIATASRLVEIELENLTKLNLQQAEAVLEKKAFDCIFWQIDSELLSIDRITAVKQKSEDTPLIIITDKIDERQSIELWKIGSVDCLLWKDLNNNGLLKSLLQALNLKQQRIKYSREDSQTDYENRLTFLGQISVLLSGNDPHNKNLRNIAWLAVPLLADWCAIEILERGNNDRYSPSNSTIIISHRDLEKERILLQMQQEYSLLPADKEERRRLWYDSQVEDNFTISEARLRSLAEDKKHLDLLQQLQIKSYLFSSIEIGRQVVGYILLGYSNSERIYSKIDLSLIEEIAIRIASNIERKNLTQETQEINENLRSAANILQSQRQQLQTLQKLNSLLNQRLTNRQELLQVMANAVCEALDRAQICSIVLYDRDTQQQSLTVNAGQSKDRLNFNDVSIWQDVCWQQILLEGGNRILQRDADLDRDPTNLPVVIYAVEIQSIKSGKLGVLAIGNWDNAFAFTSEDKKLLNAVSEQAAIAIDNARSIETLERQYQILTEQNKQLEIQRQNIEHKNQELLEASQLKSQFLATMSHELRTPMNAIVGFSQYLLLSAKNSLTQKQQQSIERILSNSKSLLSLIEDILNFSKIEARRLEQKLETIDLEKLVSTIVSELLPLVDRSKIDLEFNCYLDKKIVINDRSQLRRIVVNLIGNAIKFTDRGKIIISLQETEVDCFEIAVKDTGIGIAQEQLEYIFEAFRQVDRGTNRRYQGTGLGLAITKSLVNLMRGEIRVESELGKGSTFRAILPRNSKYSNDRLDRIHRSSGV